MDCLLVDGVGVVGKEKAMISSSRKLEEMIDEVGWLGVGATGLRRSQKLRPMMSGKGR